MTPQEALELAIRHMNAGESAVAEQLLTAVVRINPRYYDARYCLGVLFERAGRTEAAVEQYEICMQLRPGMANAWTRRNLIVLRRHLGRSVAPGVRPRKADAAGLVQMSTLGSNGRFGNQLIQYAYLRAYAETHSLELATPDWIGRDLFGLNDPFVEWPLPQLRETEFDLPSMLERTSERARADVDIWGFFVGSTSALSRFRHRVLSWFQPAPPFAEAIDKGLKKLRDGRQTLVAVHLRRGDFGYGPYWIAPATWYREWLEAVWPTLERPVLYVASDHPATCAELARFEPLTARDLGVVIPGADFFMDFMVLARSDVVAISNSTFSFSATMIGSSTQTCFRPDRAAKTLVRYDPWRGPVLAS
jgi:hypothetical protein